MTIEKIMITIILCGLLIVSIAGYYNSGGVVLEESGSLLEYYRNIYVLKNYGDTDIIPSPNGALEYVARIELSDNPTLELKLYCKYDGNIPVSAYIIPNMADEQISVKLSNTSTMSGNAKMEMADYRTIALSGRAYSSSWDIAEFINETKYQGVIEYINKSRPEYPLFSDVEQIIVVDVANEIQVEIDDPETIVSFLKSHSEPWDLKGIKPVYPVNTLFLHVVTKGGIHSIALTTDNSTVVKVDNVYYDLYNLPQIKILINATFAKIGGKVESPIQK